MVHHKSFWQHLVYHCILSAVIKPSDAGTTLGAPIHSRLLRLPSEQVSTENHYSFDGCRASPLQLHGAMQQEKIPYHIIPAHAVFVVM
jgi:hypothetical protein